MQWDLFCHVVDNFGDIGVSWRMAADLASRGESVRLWVDDPSALVWMAPQGAPNVEVIHWTSEIPDVEPHEVVVEAFGCTLPNRFVRRMAAAPRPPVWVNVEYLSAESYVERSHGLPSPQLAGPGAGLEKWFFYPGFTPRTGGLVHEPGLAEARRSFHRDDWLATHAVPRREGERVVSLFCYPNERLPAMLQQLGRKPTLLLVTPDHAARQVAPLLDGDGQFGALRAHFLRHVPQPQFDRLLWACDLNFIRGEDSFVRAQWAGVPFVWHIYPQMDGVHAMKLDAFLDVLLAGSDPLFANRLRTLWHGWNGTADWPQDWPDLPTWQALSASWARARLAETDLTTQLIRFVADKRQG